MVAANSAGLLFFFKRDAASKRWRLPTSLARVYRLLRPLRLPIR